MSPIIAGIMEGRWHDTVSRLQCYSLVLKDFQFYSKEWADFILANRANGTRTQIHNYDIVHGPIANDDVGFQIRRLLAGIITINAFLEELKYRQGITYQYFFATERSLKYLKRV